MKRRFAGALTAGLGLSALWCSGCGGDSIVKGTTPVTAIAPSHTFPYPVGPGGNGPPNAKDLMKEGKIPQQKPR